MSFLACALELDILVELQLRDTWLQAYVISESLRQSSDTVRRQIIGADMHMSHGHRSAKEVQRGTMKSS